MFGELFPGSCKIPLLKVLWDNDWGDDDDYGRGPTTRAQKARLREERNNPPPVNRIQQQPQQPPPPPQQQPPLHAIQEEDEQEDQDPLGFGLFDSDPDQPQQQQPVAGDSPRAGPSRPTGERSPGPTGEPTEVRRDRHKCPACQTLLKLYNGERVCPCTYGGNTLLTTDYDNFRLYVHDAETEAEIGEVAYARGLTAHPDYFDRPDIAAVVHACRDTGVLMSPSDTSSSEGDTDQQADDERTTGFSSSEPSPTNYASVEDDPDYAIILHHIQQRNRARSSTRYNMLDQEDGQPLLQEEGQEPAPLPQAIQQGVPPTAPATPPQQSATTPEDSPLHIQMRSGRIKQGAPKKRGRGTKGRR